MNKLTNEQLQSIYKSYTDWIADVDKNGMPEEDWWAGHGYAGREFDINFCIPYEREDDTDTSDFGVWLYSVSDDGQTISSSGTDITTQFKAYLAEKTDANLKSIYESYIHWKDDLDADGSLVEDWWAGHGYDSGEFEFDINFCFPYERDDDRDTTDFGVWIYYVSAPDYQIPEVGIDVTAQFKAYLAETIKINQKERGNDNEKI